MIKLIKGEIMEEIIVNQMKTKDEINSNFTEEEIKKFLEILTSTDSDAKKQESFTKMIQRAQE
jgi:hypothetical protein